MQILKQMLVQTIGFFALFALALFLPAGTLTWTAGWVFLALFFGFFIAMNTWLFRHNPGLLEERMKLSRPNQKGWDKLLFPFLLVFSIAVDFGTGKAPGLNVAGGGHAPADIR